MTSELQLYLSDCADRPFSWLGWHCLHFIEDWAGICHPDHAYAAVAYREANPAYGEIASERDYLAFAKLKNVRSEADMAARIAEALDLKIVDGGKGKPGMIVIRHRLRCGIMDTDYAPMFLTQDGVGLAKDAGYYPGDVLLRPRGV